MYPNNFLPALRFATYSVPGHISFWKGVFVRESSIDIIGYSSTPVPPPPPNLPNASAVASPYVTPIAVAPSHALSLKSSPNMSLSTPAPVTGPLANRVGGGRVKSAKSDSDDGESTSSAFTATSKTSLASTSKGSSYAALVASAHSRAASQPSSTSTASVSSIPSTASLPRASVSSPRRGESLTSEPASPSGPSAPRPFEPAPMQRRLSPRRRTSALVSSIDDVLASMEAAGDHKDKKENVTGN